MAIFNKTFFSVVAVGGLFAQVSVAAVQIDNLPDLSLDGVGVSTIFSDSIWQGSPSVEYLTELVKKTENLNLSRSERDILRQLLLTDTSAEPALAGGDGSFGMARAEALVNHSLFEDAITLLDQIPDEQKTPDMKQLRVSALFGSGRLAEACHESNISLWKEQEDAVRAVCVFYQGSKDEARLAFDVYREGGGKDQWVNAPMEHLFGGTGVQPEGVPPIWAVGLVADAFGTNGLKGWSKGVLQAVALNPKVSPDIRLAAAEKTILSDTERLSVWKAISDFNVSSGKKSDITERIKLYQNILNLSAEKRSKAIHDLISVLKKAGVMEAWAPVVSEMIAENELELESSDWASDMIIVHAWVNDVAKVYQWYAILSEKDEVAALRLAHIVNAMGGGVPNSIDPLVRACSAEGVCDVVLRDIPFYFPVSSELALSVPSFRVGYPGFVTDAIRKQILEGQLGIGILNSLILLGQSTSTERPLVETIEKVIPQEMGAAILRERLLRGLSSR